VKKNIFILITSFFLISFVSCSSIPKNTGDVFTVRHQTEENLRKANIEAARSNFETAIKLLDDCRRNAILVDDSSLFIRVSLSRGNVLFSINRIDEAYTEWNHAITEARRINNAELLSIGLIYKARGDIVSGRESAQAVLLDIEYQSAHLRNRLYIASYWQVKGLAHRSLGQWEEAENAIRRSLAIHESEKLLEIASYDWYTIASVRSLSGKFSEALEALEKAIELDRRSENSWGLGANYRAMGDVYVRDRRFTEARNAYERAKAIYEALGNRSEIAEIDRRINSIRNN